jgi:arsenical pump membrane protein
VSGGQLLVVCIFLVTLLAVLIRPGNMSEGVSAAIGAALLMLTGGVTLDDLRVVLHNNLIVFAFFLGMMALTTLAEEASVFDGLAAIAARLAGGSPRRLFINVFLLGALMTTFLTNDATALILTPVVYALVTRLHLDPLPFVFACTFIADTASTILPISNPINIILSQRFQGLALTDFLHYLLLPSLAAIAINILAFGFIFRNRLRGLFDLQRVERNLDDQERWAYRTAVVVLIVVGIAFVVASELRPSPVGVVAMSGAVALLVAMRFQGRLVWKRLASGISWSIFPFVAGMFLLARGLEQHGATRQLGSLMTVLVGQSTLQTVLVSTLFSAASSNLMNNVPAVAVMSATIPTIHQTTQPALLYGTLIGCDLGPNLTVVGSISTMIWLLILRRRKLEISALDYARLGVVVTPIMLVVSALILWTLLA